MKGRVLHTDATPTLGPALHLRRIHMKLKTDPGTADKTTQHVDGRDDEWRR